MDRAAFGRGGGERGVDLRAVADVARRSAGAELVRDDAEPLQVAGEQRQRRAVSGEALCDRLADPTARPRDDHVPFTPRRHRSPSDLSLFA
jgi:hypothetical protein